jgi:hypothetical protein
MLWRSAPSTEAQAVALRPVSVLRVENMLLDHLKYAGLLVLPYAGLLSLLVLPFSLYLNYKKIGHKVAASYSWRTGSFIASGIGTVTLINMKDRPLVIFDIHAVMDNLSFKLKEFNPPLILKAMEAVSVDADIVSKRYLDGKVYDWKTGRHRYFPVHGLEND